MGGVDFVNGVGEGDTPPFWYAVFKGLLDGTQYAKGQYAGRKNPVISYADINFYFKTGSIFINKHNKCGGHFGIYKLKH